MGASAPSQRAPRRSPSKLGIVVAGLLLTFFFMYLRFPYDRLAEAIETRIGNATGLRLELFDLGPSLQLLGPGIGARDVRVTLDDGAVLVFDRVRLRPAWSLSWLLGDPAVHLALEGEPGGAAGTLTLGAAPRWSGDLTDLDLDLIPAGAVMPGALLTGRADATVDIALAESGPEGTLRLIARAGSLEHPALPMVVPFETIEGDLILGGDQRAEIVSLELESPLVSGSVAGTLGHSATPETAPLRLEGAFTVSGNIRGALNAQGVSIGNNGVVEFVVMGTPAAPIVR